MQHAELFTAMTVNLWSPDAWPTRAGSVRSLLRRHPSVLCVQKLSSEARSTIDETLTHHTRVDDAEAGWSSESNIWWDTTRFSRLAHGTEPFGALEADRRLFWVRLRDSDVGNELVVATIHLTASGVSDESVTGLNRRVGQARAVAAALDELAGPSACLLMGDLNDASIAPAILREIRFVDAWSALGVVAPTTFPAFPMAVDGSSRAPLLPRATFDWQFHRGPVNPLMTETIAFPSRDSSPCDHRPLQTLYRLGADS